MPSRQVRNGFDQRRAGELGLGMGFTVAGFPFLDEVTGDAEGATEESLWFRPSAKKALPNQVISASLPQPKDDAVARAAVMTMVVAFFSGATKPPL